MNCDWVLEVVIREGEKEKKGRKAGHHIEKQT